MLISKKYSYMSKILTLDNSKLKEIKKKYKKIVLAHGVFDLLHIGHLRYLKKAKTYGDCLIVSITNDKNVNKGINRPFFNENLRLEALSQLTCVDYVILSNEINSEKIIKFIKPNIYVKGSDYKKPPKTQIENFKIEQAALKKVKAKLKVINEVKFSSSNLINTKFDNLNLEQKEIIKKINIDKIKDNKIKTPVLIFGDIIEDKFIFTQSLGKSRKNNIISTRYKKTEIYEGGSLMIAKILTNYFSNVNFLTYVSNYEFRKLKKKFKNINFINISSKQNRIVNKTRYVDEYNLSKIFQINEKDQIKITEIDEKKIINKLDQLSKKINDIVIADFGHGLITEKICKKINLISKKKYINCQANSSNFGYNKFTKYKSAKLLSCDEDEFRLSTNTNNDFLDNAIFKNINMFNKIETMIVTSGKQGSYSIKNKKIKFVQSLRINNMIDSIGCGDVFFTYFIIMSLFDIKKKLSVDQIMILCHLAASLHSQYFANSKLIDKNEFLKGYYSLSA